MVEELLKFIAGSTVAAALIGFLAQSLVKHVLSKDVALHKQKLQNEADRAIEEIRSSFRSRELVHRKLHERRLEILPQMHGLLIDALAAIEPCIAAMSIDDHHQRREKYLSELEPIEAFSTFFKKNRIWLTTDLAQRLEVFNSEHVEGLTKQFAGLLDMEKRGHGKTWIYKEVGPYWEKVNEEAPVEGIEEEFRRVLGVLVQDQEPL